MDVTRADSASPVGVPGNLRRLMDALDRPAAPSFVLLTIGLAWLSWFLLANADYANFTLVCNHDPGAVLRVDEVVALGKRPGVDFLYHYGPLPLLVTRAFFGVVGRSPLTLLVLLGLIGCGFSAGLASIAQSFKATRVGVVIMALASVHTITVPVPTHAIEAALLVWAVALRLRKQRAAPLALSVCALFVKISMGSVLLAGFIALTLCDAIRERSSRPARSLLIVPCVAALLFFICSLALGPDSVIACFAPRLGAALYRAADLGFLREGRHFWQPTGHTLGWYLGGLPGPWIVASLALLVLGPMAAVRFMRGVLQGKPKDSGALRDETFAIASVANLAFVIAFFGPSSGVCYYAWIPLVGLAPVIANARWSTPAGERSNWTSYAWLALAGFLALSSKATLAQFVGFLRQPRVWIGQASIPVDEAAELKEALALAHRTGTGTVSVVARVANFGLVDPTLREGRYWMMQVGMRTTPSIAELLNLAQSSDALFVTQFDYPGLLRIPEFRPLLTQASHLHDGRYFLVLRPAGPGLLPR